MDLAMGAGLGQGIGAFTDTLLKTQNMLQQQAVAKQLANAQSLDAASKVYTVTGINPYSQGLLGRMGIPAQSPSEPSPQAAAPTQTSVMVPPVGGMPSGSASPGGFLPVSATSHSMPQPQQQQAGGLLQLLQPDSQGLSGFQKLSQREQGLVGPALGSDIMGMSRRGAAEQQKLEADVNNAQMDQTNKGIADFKDTKKEFQTSADAYQKLDEVLKRGLKTGQVSPKEIQSAAFQLVKLDMPGQAVREAPLEELAKNPNVSQRVKDAILSAKTGAPSIESIQDLMRVANDLHSANLKTFRSAQNDERANAASRGVKDAGYVNVGMADQTEKILAKNQKLIGPYQPPSPTSVIAAATNEPIANAIGSAGSGLLSGGKGLLANLIPSQSRQATASTPPLPKVGTVQKGYRFLGGDPSSPKSWAPAGGQ